MLAREDRSITSLTRYRLGTVLVWIGVLTWAPFILFRTLGYRPSILWFLPFHLFGVVVGSRLRSAARREMGSVQPIRNRMRVAGHRLIFGGVMVWLPYLYLKLAAQKPVDVAKFLPFHLIGVLGGLALMGISANIDRKGS